MGKIIAAINMTLDGFCDHTAVVADDGLHNHYSELLKSTSLILYGRKTFQLMEYWRDAARHPTGIKADDEFAAVMDKIPKIVFSRTLKSTDWESARLAQRPLKDEVLQLRQSEEYHGKDILVGSPSLIATLTKLRLIDEYQLCVHPVVAGNGLPLFKDVDEKFVLALLKTKTLSSGATVLYYRGVKDS
ncbi:MAG: dihydrofolate reductase [Flavobacterium sp.]|nr:MAG: dihydrofolate reductase [Flavobacterium sp.]